MAVGDLITYKGQHWKILSEDELVQTINLQNWDNVLEEVALDNSDLGKPVSMSRWPFLTAPSVSLRAKRPVRLTRTVRGRLVELVPFNEWSPTGLLRLGGPIFLSPTLGLLPGETLSLHYEGGQVSRLVVPRNLRNVAQRRKRMEKKASQPKTLYDFLEDED